MLLWRNCNLLRELVKIVLVLAFMLLLCVGNLSAQYAKLVDSKKYSKTEMSLFNASVGYFESGDYTNAYMGFSQLHSWYASDPVFSYYCGASMVMLRTEYDKAIKYLTLAYDNKLYDADYYLGLAYHRKYLFSKSITFYSRYRDYLVQATKGKSPKIAEVESLMEKANKARALGKESYVLKVISNNKVKRSNFHFSYGRKILDGNIVVKPDFFRQRNDKNNKDIDLVYVLDTIAFVSSYGSDMKTGLDLYVSHKTDEGWSPLHLLTGNINTDSDEAFPFLASDRTLYFASKGHNSIGGYDIFKSVYDSVSGHWGEPENLGFPINTPYDDFMYAIESNGNSAFFASDRTSKDGQVMVCRYIVEETPEKLHIETEEHLAEQAELPITPGAEAEYNRIVQEQQDKTNEVKDSTAENKEVKHEIDTTDLFATTKSMLEEKVSAISNYQDYSRKLNAYARITSNKIRAIRNGESDADMSSSDITKMANSVVTYYDLSQKFNSVYSTAKPTLDYCTKEMLFLDKLETGSGEYQFKLQNLNISVEKVNAKSPLEALIEEKKNERKQADDALKKLSRNMGKIQKSLSGINKDLEAKMLAIQNETDPVLREKYINEHKALENSKIDVISSKKNMDIEAKRLNAMMARADETIRMLEDIEDIIANLDLSELDETEDIGTNDILALQNFISDEDNKEIAEYEKEVENDESLYSEKIDYEAIAANNSSALTDIVNEVAEYKGDMSKSTSAVVGMIVQSDSLYSQKSRFEAQFDVAESDEEKKELLGKINATQKQIDERGKAIESGLVYEPNSSVSKAIDDFNSIKQEKVNSSDWPELVSSTQNLIEKSRKLESQISESKSEANAGVDKSKLLEKIKSDIDNQIVDNVEEMQGIVVAQQSGKKDIAAMNAEIARIRSAAKDKNAETDVKKDVNSASKKIVESKQGGSGSVTTLNDAENILAGAVGKRIAILNEEYEAESQVYDVLAGKYVKSKSTESQKQQADVIYYSALEDRQQAESVTDEVEKMRYLSEANKKMKSANSALLQVVSSVSKPEMQQDDVLTQDILSLYDDIKEQKGVSSSAGPVETNVSQTSSGQNVAESSVDKSTATEMSVNAQFLTSVTLQTTLADRIATNTTEISDIETNLAIASRTDRKRLQTELGEVTTERNGNVRSLGEEKQRFYSELDKAVNEEISKFAVSAEYANRYADYRQSLYSLTTAEPSDENITEKLTEAEKSEYALLQTIIPNVNDGTAAVLIDIYSILDDKYGTSSPAELVEASATSGQNVTESSVDKSGTSEVSGKAQLQTSVTLQTTLANRIASNTSEITDIETNLATVSRTDRKRLQTELGEVTTERNSNVRSLGEEKQRFYSELDKAVSEEISKSAVSAEYANRYADYRQSLYSLTTAEPSDENITEKLTEAEKSEYALLQTIIPNVNDGTAAVLIDIYSILDDKYGAASPNEPVEANISESTSGQNVVVSSVDKSSASAGTSNTQFHTSVTLQTTLANRIATNTTEISDIETNLATASRTDRKRLQTELGEITTERNGNVRSLGEEKQRFYSELDRAVNEEISKSAVSAEYANRYADYRQSLYSLTAAEKSDENISEKLTEAEKSEYALLQTIIPNVNDGTAAVFIDIYSILDDKYGASSPSEPVEANTSESITSRNIAMSDIAVSSVESSHPLNDSTSPAELVEANATSGQNVAESSVNNTNASDVSGKAQLQTSVTLQTTLTNRIAANTTEISDIETNLATASRTDRKRLQTELGEVTTERNGNVRSLGEEKQRFYSELDKAVNEEISKSAVSAEYANRYADYRQSLYSLTTADPLDENISEKLTEAEKSEYALLQTIIPNVNDATAAVLIDIYSILDDKYGTPSSAESVEANSSESTTGRNVAMSDVAVSSVESSHPLSDPSSPSEPVEASVSQSTSGQNVVVSSVDNTTSSEGTGNAQLQTSVTLQTTLTNRIATNTTEITDIETNLATSSRTDRKRLQTELGEVTTERNGNVRLLGEEKQRFYSELDKSVNEEIFKSAVSAEYASRYADYRQSLYSLTTAEPSDENITEKLTEAEKSEYALLQTIIPNVNAETASVLSPIYNSLAAKYGTSLPAEPVEANATSNQNVAESSVNNTNTSEVSGKAQLQTSVTLQTTLANRITTNTTEISDIETNLATASRTDRKRLQTELGEVTTERNGNVRSLGEEKQRFYSELDKAVSEEISKSAVSAEYANRYADYRQSLYSLTTAEPSDENITEKLTEAEKSEYALLQTIIPNVNAETASVLSPIYNSLAAKYGISSPAELVEANATSGQNVAESSVNNTNASDVSGKAQLQTSVTLQTTLTNRIATNTTEITDIETNLATASRTDRKRLQTELGEVTNERKGNVRSLGEEKQRFYSELDKAVNEEISKSAVSAEYANRYADYRQSLYSLTTADPLDENISEKLTEAEKSEYALLQTIIPNVNAETASVLSPIYNSLAAKYGTSSPAEPVEASVSQTSSGQNVAVSTILPESYSQSMNFQEQMIRNIDISTREIERLEQRKDGARKSEQRRISDDIAREESQKLDDIQKLAVEKSRFYSDINQSLENALPKLSDSVRNEYVSAYEAYNETLTTMKIGLGFYDMQKANKIYEDSEIKEYKLLQQMKQVTTGDVRNVVDNMILRMESKNSNLRKYRVVVSYTIEEVAENNTSTSNVSGKSDNRIISANGSDAVNNIQVEVAENNTSTGGNVFGKSDNVSISTSVSNTTDVANANVDSLQDKSKRKSMSGYNTDSYGIYEMPEINMGLYYRIQIVAVSLKYRMRDFKGLSLIFTEQIPNTNIIRYMTGEYYRYVSAREDLPKVRGLGFSDAFIVAYYNGKRISIGEARRLEALQNAGENEEIPVVIRHEAPAGYVEPEDIIASAQTKSETVANTENNVIVENGIVNGQNVLVNGGVTNSSNGTAIEANGIPAKGVYFTVQVGVYKDRRRSSQLKGVSPVAYETMPNGFIRHISGLFTDYSQARTSQMNIRRQGITDAFVIAYIDGRKVSFSEGVEYQKSLDNRTIAEANVENTTSKSQTSVSSEENLSNVEYAPLNLNTGTEENNKDGISYYVQIGAFSKSPDPEILSVFSKVAGDKIHVKFPREGLQIYRIGVFNSYEEAQNTLAEARSFGIVDAFIVAFKGDEQISSSEAIRLQNTVRQIESNSGDTIRNDAVQKSSSQTVQPSSNVEPKPVVPKETLQQTQGGVEYFVQLGAFVNTPDARSMATFRSIATNNGSRLSTVKNGRFTNYRVGAFSKFNDAKSAVDNARSMGVTDAFIVSFYNGDRIPVVEAKEKEAK